MKKLTSNEIRNMFLSFFEEKGHKIIPSASLVPKNDDSILWINAGVAPLKKYFDGREKPPKKRLCNAQKCIRTNDIDNVGDTYHHTFFEMLGNFSIGDYFREEALEYAFELLTSKKYFAIDKEKLYITYYPDDLDTFNKWVSLGISPDHLIKCKDNFWDIGPGPCGPDTEIFYDRGEKFDPNKLGIKLIEDDIDNERYIEIWNNVFSQFNHIEGKERKDFPELPNKNIDTGMGLERIVCVLEGCKTNYDTDLFRPIISKVEEISGVKYKDQKEFRIISDHIKTIVFALSDGAIFSNEKRGYVLRRLLRRASRFGRKLNIYTPFLYLLVDVVVEMMGDYYKNLKSKKDSVKQMILKEEESFLKTLSSGESRLNDLIKSGNKITGEDVFKLYDTYGFPFELTSEILSESNIKIDKDEFDKCMEKQKEMARSASKKTSGMNTLGDVVNFKEESLFVGYDSLSCTAKVIFVGDNSGNVTKIYNEGIIITDKTTFYPCMGGQEGDIGKVYNDSFKADVIDTKKAPNGQAMHFLRIISGSINVGDIVTLEVDEESRYKTCQNHSATHLLQKALQDVLGSSVYQAGSYVDSNILRFDFNYEGKIKDEDIIKVEEKVNLMIHENNDCKINYMNIDDAKKLGAMALFSEKYDENVRVVKLGDSIELCGGTHVTNTKNIRSFAIKSVESKGLNIYRIEAVCDTNLEIELFKVIKPYNDEMILLLNKAKKIIKQANEKDIKLEFDPVISNDRPKCYKDILDNKKEIENLRKSVANLEKEFNDKLNNLLLDNIDSYLNELKDGKYGKILIKKFENQNINTLKVLTGNLVSKIDKGIVFLINSNSSSINFICKATDNLKDEVNIGALIKNVSKIAGGNGGGSTLFAQGGGTDTSSLDMIINYVKQEILKD